MIKKNEWVSYAQINEIPDNGVLICHLTDAVLDTDCWPVWAVVMCNGKVVEYQPLYVPTGGYSPTDMTGWDKRKFADWFQYQSPSDPHQETNSIMWLSEEPEKYWFCASIRTDVERELVLKIMSYYQVRGYAIGNGDDGEFMVIDQEMRKGDLHLAEWAFHGCGTVWWEQAGVCPICKDKGESICGHMYYSKAFKYTF